MSRTRALLLGLPCLEAVSVGGEREANRIRIPRMDVQGNGLTGGKYRLAPVYHGHSFIQSF